MILVTMKDTGDADETMPMDGDGGEDGVMMVVVGIIASTKSAVVRALRIRFFLGPNFRTRSRHRKARPGPPLSFSEKLSFLLSFLYRKGLAPEVFWGYSECTVSS